MRSDSTLPYTNAAGDGKGGGLTTPSTWLPSMVVMQHHRQHHCLQFSSCPLFCLDLLLSVTVDRPTEAYRYLDYVAASRLLVVLARHCLPSLSKLTQHLDPPLLDGANCFLALFDLRLAQRLERPARRRGKSRKKRD